jgi:hypothetical protein
MSFLDHLELRREGRAPEIFALARRSAGLTETKG